MRGLRKMLAISIIMVNQVEGTNIIQIFLFHLFSTASMIYLCFFLFAIIEIFNNLCCSLGTRNKRNLFLSRTKLLFKMKNFKRVVGELVHLSAMPTEVGRKFAKLT